MATLDSSSQSLIRRTQRIEADIDAAISSIISTLDRELERVIREIADAPTEAARFQILADIPGAVGAVTDKVQAIEEIYGAELRAVGIAIAESAGGAVVASGADAAVINALIDFDLDAILEKITNHAVNIRAQVTRQVMAGVAPDIDMLLPDSSSRLKAQLSAELNTAVAGFSRTVALRKAEDAGLELFVYAGPLDQITRPFCRERVGRVFTKAEVADWDNGQGLPAAVYLGGYNCRHRLNPISRKRAREVYGY